ncbi:hypothetical protein [Glycomyces harbinensis]|uniref:Right handed beta helix region n=1 Tax=Glycomyces harbinensis TaxID=58114 RepID=A0A1G6WXD6_9ACTN|nr:hypothetical protein [Glycomyces harbinensis]SDD70521.1 hypothetical protein SAMN05216270_106258 [Glycomyces harbinensis]
MSTDRTITRRGLTALGLGGIAGAALAAPAHAADDSGEDRRAQIAAAEPVATVADLREKAGTAHGETVYLVGYFTATPGRGGGLLFWDEESTEDDNGGTVFAVTGTATGRWKRQAESRVDLTWFGWSGTGTADPEDASADSDLLQAAVDALPSGGTVAIGPGLVLLRTTVNVLRVPITFAGAGHSDNLETGTQIVVDTTDADGFLLTGVRGGGFRDLQIRGLELEGGSLIRTERAGPEPEDGNYMLAFSHVRFRDGYNGTTLRGCNTVRFQNCVWNTFTGEYVVLLNGVADDTRADPIEFVQCGIAAGSGNHATDNVIVDGLGGSLKFIATAILFGRHGLWMRNTTGSAALPKFVYFEGGGFENTYGYSVLLERGAQAQFANAYISTDGELDLVRVGPDFVGGVTFAGCVIRGAGRNGIDFASRRLNVSGCLIGNNGRTAHVDFGRSLSGLADNGDGAVRVTTADPHGWETGDRVTVYDVAGADAVNSKWTVTVIDDDSFDLQGSEFTGSPSGGAAYRHGAGVSIREGATRVVLTGNGVGGFVGDGTNRQDYAFVTASPDVLVSANDFNGNHAGGLLMKATPTAETRISGNKGTGDVDGWFSARVGGAVANGALDFGNNLFVAGQHVTVVKAAHAIDAGSCKVRFAVDGDAATGPLTVGQEAAVQTISGIAYVDGSAAPKRIGLLVEDASADAAGLTVQFGYRLAG